MVMRPLAWSPSSVIAEQSTNNPQSTLSSLKQWHRFEESEEDKDKWQRKQLSFAVSG